MNPSDKPEGEQQIPEAVLEPESKGFPVVWLLPLVALLVGGWLWFKTISEQGPEIVIRFQTAEGIEEGKTQVKYRDVNVGQVKEVLFPEDLSHIKVTVEMAPDSEPYLTESTQFWVVLPRIGAGGISGLSTLVSGAYIGMDPGTGGEHIDDFTGLEKPPIVTSDEEGTSYRLQAERLGSISVGSPVYFRQIKVGEVIDYALAGDQGHVEFGIFVTAPHDQYIRTGTRFWNAGGMNVSLGAEGMQVEMESLVSLLSGGIAFETPDSLLRTEHAPKDTMYRLFDSHKQSREELISRGYRYVLNFTDSLRGLSIGAPVEFRGIRIGTVTGIDHQLVAESGQMALPVYVELEPERTLSQAELDEFSGGHLKRAVNEHVEELVALGMRARLQTGSLLTGQRFVEMELYPDVEVGQVSYEGAWPEIPTMPGTLANITTNINKLFARLEAAPLEQTLENLNQLSESLNSLVSKLDQEAPGLTKDARDTLQAATGTLESMGGVVARDGELGNELYQTLNELRAAARSIRVMAEYLERHPEALIKGKGSNP